MPAKRVPEGRTDISPAFQRWENAHPAHKVPEGRPSAVQSSLRDLQRRGILHPSDESLGYFRAVPPARIRLSRRAIARSSYRIVGNNKVLAVGSARVPQLCKRVRITQPDSKTHCSRAVAHLPILASLCESFLPAPGPSPLRTACLSPSAERRSFRALLPRWDGPDQELFPRSPALT